MQSSCIFCKMVSEPSRVPHRIAESDHAFAFLDFSPIRRGHTLVIPKRHATDLSDVRSEDYLAMMSLARQVAQRLRRHLGTTGENLLVASGPGSEQSVFHLHVHIIPRLPDDDLRWNDWWATKILPVTEEQLASLASELRE